MSIQPPAGGHLVKELFDDALQVDHPDGWKHGRATPRNDGMAKLTGGR
jgi:hypothetical protein